MHKQVIKDRIEFYKNNKKLIDSGQHNYVPFYGFPRLSKYIPGVVPGIMYKITSHMGVGKTQLAKYLFVYQTMLYAIKYKINFKIIYFALEESKEEFLDGLFIHLAKRIHKADIERFPLTGYSTKSISPAELKIIEDTEISLANLMHNIHIEDDTYQPTKIYNKCRKYAEDWGKFIQNAEGEDIQYIPNDPKQIVLVVNDHISLLESEFDPLSKKMLSDRETISKWHTHYARRVLAKKWKWAILNVQQQNLESEKQQFTSGGSNIINKLLPTLEGLANNKEVGRDDYVNIGLFAPARYPGIEEFRGYPIDKGTPLDFGDRFRTMHLLKNRLGEPNKTLPLYFDGRYNYFKEMPLATDPGMTYFYNLLKT